MCYSKKKPECRESWPWPNPACSIIGHLGFTVTQAFNQMELAVRFELTTYSLQNYCATVAPHQHDETVGWI